MSRRGRSPERRSAADVGLLPSHIYNNQRRDLSDLKAMKLPRFARARARRLVESPRELARVIEEARRKLASAERGRSLKPGLAELRTMLDLLRAWARCEYSCVSPANLLVIVGAVVYFLTPADLVPDFILALGLADDAAVIAWVVGVVTDELAKYKAWQAR